MNYNRFAESYDQLLRATGWAVQDYKEMNFNVSLGVDVRVGIGINLEP